GRRLLRITGFRATAQPGQKADVDPRYQVAQGRQRVVVFVNGNFVAVAAGVAIQPGFREQIGTATGQHPEPAGPQAGADGGDAQADGVVAAPDSQAGGPQFRDLGGAGRVGVPDHLAALAQCGGVLVEGSLAQVTLALQPQHVVAVEDTPQGG